MPTRVISREACCAVVLAVSAWAARQPASSHAGAIREFEEHVARYLKIHKQAEAALPRLKPTDSPAAISRHALELADRIRRARPTAKQGDIFSPTVAAEFRRLIGVTMAGPAGPRIRQSLRSSEPVRVSLRVNDRYPPGVPLQTTPPTLLENLPRLPAELHYRLVGDELVLRDETANLVVDVLPAAVR